MAGTPISTPTRSGALTVARIATIVLFVAQFLPFTAGGAFVSHENEDPLTTGGGRDSAGAYHSGYVAEISGYSGDNGWQVNDFAWLGLILLAALFFTRLRDRPGWSRWCYWAAAVLAVTCTDGIIPPLSKPGGIVSAIGLAMMVYAAYRNQQAQAPTQA